MTLDNVHFNPTSIIKAKLTIEEKQKMLSKIQINSDSNFEWTVTKPVTKKDIYTGELIEKTELVAECEFYKDSDNSIWINRIISYGVYQGIGIGTLIIKQAIEKFGLVFMSNATQSKKALFSKDKPNDLRYYSDTLKFEDSNIGKFAIKLIEKGILSKDNIRNPDLKY